jgi:hypothetical protein
MAKSIRVIPKKRGRPATGKDPLVATRMPPELIRAIDQWAAAHAEGSRSEAIRRLVEQALKGASGEAAPIDPGEPASLWPMPSEQPGSGAAAAKAAGMAAQQIEKLVDPSVPVEERQTRKRRLLKGPKEFRDIRGDQPKPKK